MLSFISFGNLIFFITSVTSFPVSVNPVTYEYVPINNNNYYVETIIENESDQIVSGPPVINPEKDLRSSVIKTAISLSGIDYTYGGASPEYGFDCSGFIMYVYYINGVELPHSASAQADLGYVITESEAQPGDLVYWGSHIGFWISPGIMIDSAEPGTVTSIRSIWESPEIIRLKV